MLRSIAFYLPQYHPIPENDNWWGKGFTEWTNVTKAKPLFRGHKQPRLPADLSYYDLRVPESRKQQADMARAYGLDGFIYYHYWFGNGKQLIERPFNEVLSSGEPDFPFCLCWANQTWSGVWHGAPDKILIQQEYPGPSDNEQHFNYLFNAFRDKRYMKVNGKPIFMVYDTYSLPDAAHFAREIKAAAERSGLPGIHLLASNIVKDDWNPLDHGFDGKVSNAYNKALDAGMGKSTKLRSIQTKLNTLITGKSNKHLNIIDHRKLVKATKFIKIPGDIYPLVVPNWDNTPRSGNRGLVLTQSSPQLFKEQLDMAAGFLKDHASMPQLLFIKSWNEWAEGNYLEPDTIDGFNYLEMLKSIK